MDVVNALRYRKRSVEVEANRLSSLNGQRLVDWIQANGGKARHVHSDPIRREVFDGDCPNWVEIETLEGTMIANVGDWIIRGVAGEFYPCKADIFEQTYEPMES
ncbi:hypothetical protein [Nocardia sp. NPDC004860]|uniref:hypothetical protein n=1 Tax=Nocardia sp. NPDC004860 TaxID=3154557 RepID=UPI0033A64464